MSPWPPSRRRKRQLWGIDAQGLAWQDDAGPQCAPHTEATPQALARARHGVPVDVVAGTDLAVHWVQRPPAATRSLHELQLVAAARCAHLHGGAAADWWVAADWNPRRPFVCAALPRAVVQPLQDAAVARGIAVRWHTAWGVVASARAASLPDDGWCAMRTPRSVLLWHCTRGQVDVLTAVGVAPNAGAEEVQALLAVTMQLEAAGSGLAADVVHWADSGARGDRHPREALASLAIGELLDGGRA